MNKKYPRFSYKDFIGMNDPKKITKMLRRKGAKLVGRGSSRIVFQISPNRVIKIDDDTEIDWVKRQNKCEVKKYNKHCDSGLLARCYWYSPDYTWLISEFAQPISEKEYQKWWRDNCDSISKLGLDDLWACNCGRVGNRIVIVDAGI